MPTAARPAAGLAWFKSSYSGGNTTECLETAFLPSGVLVRDSKRPGDPWLVVSEEAWMRFVRATTHLPCSVRRRDRPGP
ncbi:DUF397 domain-containing protein [Streptomyces olindensis]|uniref:DUF397 domain-containing protein n=1 Tax=Streptomyces olindensis TaxID=358823 RepID=UPI00364BF58A